MDDWKAYDLKLVTAQQYSDVTVFAHRTLEDAQTAVMPRGERRQALDRDPVRLREGLLGVGERGVAEALVAPAGPPAVAHDEAIGPCSRRTRPRGRRAPVLGR